MALPRYVLAPTHLDGGVFGWQLTRDGKFLGCHETFVQASFNRDVEGAMNWAEQIIGTRQDWQHTREGGPDRWIAADPDGPAAAGTDVLRTVEPGTLVVPVGPGGAGKSTFAAEAGIVTVVSLDSLRAELSPTRDAGDQSVTPAAVARQHALLEDHLGTGTTVYVDNTNVEVRVRAGLIEQARRHGRDIVALRFLPHRDTAAARNRARPSNRRVPDDVFAWQYGLARTATPQVLLAEGFTAAHDIVTPL